MAAFVAVLLFGTFLRVFRLHTIPPGLFFDEAANLFDLASILQGAHPLYFPANNGREPLFFYWASLFARVWGLDAYALRLAAAVAGSLTIAATFFCAREAGLAWGYSPRRASWLAVAAAFVLSVTYMHLHFSRFGLRTITLPLFLALTVGFLLRGMRRGSWWSLALAGAIGGASIYTYLSSRLAPALLAIPPFASIPSGRFWLVARQMLLVGAVWAIASVPLGLYFLRHPEDLQTHADDVSILNPANNHGDPAGAILHGAAMTLGSFNVAGAPASEQNLPGRPILDPLASLFLACGLGALGAGAVRRQPKAGLKALGPPASLRLTVSALLIGWILDQSIPSALAVNPPGYVRMTGLLPPLAIVVGFGIDAAWRALIRWHAPSAAAGAVVGLALAGSIVLTVRDYFVVWGSGPLAYHAMMADKSDSAAYLARLAGTDRVFLAPLYAQDNTIRFLTRGVRIDSFDLGKSLVVPTDRARPVHYFFPVSDAAEAAQVARELPAGVNVATVSDPSRRFPLLTSLDLPTAALPPTPTDRIATFQDAIALIRADAGPDPAKPGGTLSVTLEWLALAPVPENYTVFLHLRDLANHTVTQVDRQPTDGSFPTASWQTGDLVQDRYSLELPPSLPAGHFRLVGGLYRLADLARLPALTATGAAPGAEVMLAEVEIVAP